MGSVYYPTANAKMSANEELAKIKETLSKHDGAAKLLKEREKRKQKQDKFLTKLMKDINKGVK